MPAAIQGCEVCEAFATAEPRIAETPCWRVTLSADQGYLGRAFVSAKRHVGSLSELTVDEWTDLHRVISGYEQAITNACGAEMFNWGCLMNNAFKSDDPSPHVHWHVRPRYKTPVTIAGNIYVDPNFAHNYDRSHHNIRDRATIIDLSRLIQDHFNAN